MLFRSRQTASGGWVDGAYAQDSWKIRDNLTVNFGVRYDISLLSQISNVKSGAYYDLFDFNVGEDVLQNMPKPCSTTQFAPCLPGGTLPAHVVVSSKPGQLYFADTGNIQPRVGVSYSFRPNTVVHAGYGRVYDNWAAVEQSAQNVDGWLMLTQTQLSNLNTQPGLTSSTATTAENPIAGFGGNYPTPTPFGSI